MPNNLQAELKNWPHLIKKYKNANPRKAVIQLVNTFLPFFTLWVLMYFSLSWSYWITLVLALINGFFLSRIFIIQHDCGHQSFFKSTKWNNRIGFLCSFFSSIPFAYWARVHSYHHGHAGQLEHRNVGDIPLLTTNEYRQLNKWQQFGYRIFRNPLILFGVTPMVYLLVSNRFPFFNFKGWQKVRRAQVLNNVCLAGVYISLAYILGWKQFILVHLPIVFFFGMIAFWFFYVQHQYEKTYLHWENRWDYLSAAIQGSSYYKLPKVFQWLTGNIGFHHIHHLSALIPNYNLEQCARENPILQKYTTVITFKESLKTISNKLWDEHSQRMISFKEFYQEKKQP